MVNNMIGLCLKIFFVRILDVSLGTIRTMFTVKSKKLIASCIGFFEVLVWFLIVREALNTDESSMMIAISYSLGFATGTYIGTDISNKIISGKVVVQAFTDNLTLADKLRNSGYAVTTVLCSGYNNSEKHMLYISVDKKKESELRKLIHTISEDAFIIESELNYSENGYYK